MKILNEAKFFSKLELPYFVSLEITKVYKHAPTPTAIVRFKNKLTPSEIGQK